MSPLSAQEKKMMICSYIDEVWNRGNLGFLDHLLSPTYRRYISSLGPPLDSQAQKERIAGFRKAFPDATVTVDDLIVDDNNVSFRATLRGTHKAVFQGVSPEGKQVVVSSVEIIRFEGQKFAEHWGGPDFLSLLMQLGAIVGVKEKQQ